MAPDSSIAERRATVLLGQIERNLVVNARHARFAGVKVVKAVESAFRSQIWIHRVDPRLA